MRIQILLSFGLAAALIVAVPSLAAAAQTHVVQPGDTLWAIAGRYNVSVDTIAAANGLADPDALRLGQRLVIPGGEVPAARTPSVSSSVIHVVQPGDTLWSIASRHNVSVSAIVQANGLADPDRLKLGQRLKVPVPSGRRSPVITAMTKHAPVAPATRMVPRGALPSRGAKWGSALIANAARLVGIRYRWGGMSPAGFDCSGFINYVMRSVGVPVPRTTFAMWQGGTPVPRDQLKVGDIVFFQTVSPGPSHAGIYIGNNQFAHSSSGFGHVTVTSLDYRYYKPRYLGARRF